MDKNPRMDGLNARDQEYRRQMEAASEALVNAVRLELESMGLRYAG